MTGCGIVGDSDEGVTKKWKASDGVSEEFVKCYRGNQREPCAGSSTASIPCEDPDKLGVNQAGITEIQAGASVVVSSAVNQLVGDTNDLVGEEENSVSIESGGDVKEPVVAPAEIISSSDSPVKEEVVAVEEKEIVEEEKKDVEE